MKTIMDLARITGVSIRTLRYYDQVGLLRPAERTGAGCRMYDEASLEQLQMILFYREMELPLSQIKRLMEQPQGDKASTLLWQKAVLQKRINRLKGIVELIEDVLRGANTRSFGAFDNGDVKAVLQRMEKTIPPDALSLLATEQSGGGIEGLEEQMLNNLNEESRRVELMRWYGGKEQLISAPAPDLQEEQKKIDALYRELAQRSPEAEEGLIRELGERHKALFGMDNARALLLEFAAAFEKDETMAKANDAMYGVGSAQYFTAAIRRYYGM